MAAIPEEGRAGRDATSAFGILLIDKPAGPTSHDVVNWVRWALNERSVGHCGTLDPAATGLLVVCVGAATKLVEYLTSVDKRYIARFMLGRSTTTADAQGETIDEVELPADAVARALEIATEMVGDLDLPPPAYSAIKVDGRRAHALARAGTSVELALRPMTVTALAVVGSGPDWIDVDLTVSKGTYVRSLAEELGRRLDLPTHLGTLRRLACGALSVDDPAVVGGLVGRELPMLAPHLSQAPRWRVEVPKPESQPAAEPAAELDPDAPPPNPRLPAATALLRGLTPAWLRMEFGSTEVEGTGHLGLFDRLHQGQRLALDPSTRAVLGLHEDPTCELHALVDRAGGRMILVRHEPDEHRIAPVRVLRFAPLPPASPTVGH